MDESIQYDFEKLARVIAIERLKTAQNAPQAAAEIAAQTILAGVRSTSVKQPPALTVAAVCQGVMNAMLLHGADLPPGAIEILKQMAHLGQELHIDPSEMMTWGMQGIAEAAVMAPDGAVSGIRDAIDEHLMGAGEIFGDFCRKAASP